MIEYKYQLFDNNDELMEYMNYGYHADYSWMNANARVVLRAVVQHSNGTLTAYYTVETE